MRKSTTKAATIGEDVSQAVAPPRAQSKRQQASKAQPRSRHRYTTRISKKVVATIREQLEQGSPLAGAAAVAGVPRRTFFDWLARGTNGSGSDLERELARAVELALDRAQADGAVSIWRDGDWRARLAIMERRWPETWGPPERRVQHGGAIGLYPANEALSPERLREAVESGEFTDAEVQVAARFWRWVRGQAADIVDGEMVGIDAGEGEVEAA